VGSGLVLAIVPVFDTISSGLRFVSKCIQEDSDVWESIGEALTFWRWNYFFLNFSTPAYKM